MPRHPLPTPASHRRGRGCGRLLSLGLPTPTSRQARAQKIQGRHCCGECRGQNDPQENYPGEQHRRDLGRWHRYRERGQGSRWLRRSSSKLWAHRRYCKRRAQSNHSTMTTRRGPAAARTRSFVTDKPAAVTICQQRPPTPRERPERTDQLTVETCCCTLRACPRPCHGFDGAFSLV